MPGLRDGPICRIGSPSGVSTLTISAPISPRICVASGPSTAIATSMTRIPASGPGIALPPLLPTPAGSEHFVNLIDRPLGRAASGADREDPVEPVVTRRFGLEHDRGAEIILRRIDGLAAVETLHDLRRPVPQAAIDHADRRAVISLQDEPHIQRRDAVGAGDDPVGAARQYDAAQPLAREIAAGDQPDAAIAVRRRTDRLHAGNL